MAKDPAHRVTPFAGRGTRLGRLDRGGHDVLTRSGGGAQFVQRRLHRPLVAALTPSDKTRDLIGLGLGVGDHDGLGARGERRGRGLGPFVHPDHGGLRGLDPRDPLGVALDQP